MKKVNGRYYECYQSDKAKTCFYMIYKLQLSGFFNSLHLYLSNIMKQSLHFPALFSLSFEP